MWSQRESAKALKTLCVVVSVAWESLSFGVFLSDSSVAVSNVTQQMGAVMKFHSVVNATNRAEPDLLFAFF